MTRRCWGWWAAGASGSGFCPRPLARREQGQGELAWKASDGKANEARNLCVASFWFVTGTAASAHRASRRSCVRPTAVAA